ncbi:hypothetical protein SKAU_G00184830 [Synaphobranchus kaupii]|uniref:Uncharacterized protein n=1 Tax=Synaphobranchus kaupii TaxID=118154 RepID=A0A9Q1IVS0_SYNKA|nr:hypothetical protein SKAU_G00184830 [Synaphobranchus kaupii]
MSKPLRPCKILTRARVHFHPSRRLPRGFQNGRTSRSRAERGPASREPGRGSALADASAVNAPGRSQRRQPAGRDPASQQTGGSGRPLNIRPLPGSPPQLPRGQDVMSRCRRSAAVEPRHVAAQFLPSWKSARADTG